MSDTFFLKIDLLRLARRLSVAAGRSLGAAGAARWLHENGFSEQGNLWLSEATGIALLERAEILKLLPADEPGGAEEAYESVRAEDPPATPPPDLLTPEQRARMSLMPNYELCRIPRIFIGSAASVKLRWRPMARAIIRSGGVQAATKGLEDIHVDDTPGLLVAKLYRGFSISNGSR